MEAVNVYEAILALITCVFSEAFKLQLLPSTQQNLTKNSKLYLLISFQHASVLLQSFPATLVTIHLLTQVE